MRGVSERLRLSHVERQLAEERGQLQVRRRLRQGLMAVANYTFSKATDDAAAFTTADLNGAVIAQDWLDLDAERRRRASISVIC